MITTKDLYAGYENKLILKGLDLQLMPENLSVLAGPNGAGKSTLLFALLGFLRPQKGEINLFGKPLARYTRPELAKLIAFVPQESFFQFDYSVFDIVMMGRYPYLGFMQSWSPEDKEIVTKLLDNLSLRDMKDRLYSSLSGGEKQRVLIARALAQQTSYIFLDESLSELDINHQVEIIQLLRNINREQGIGILLVSHNLNLAANYADELVFLKDGKLLGCGKPEEMMNPGMLKELFGLDLSTHPHPQSGTPNLIYPAPTV